MEKVKKKKKTVIVSVIHHRQNPLESKLTQSLHWTQFIGKLIVVQLLKKFPAFYGIRRLIAAGFEVLGAMTPCNWVGIHWRFGGTCRVHLPDWTVNSRKKPALNKLILVWFYSSTLNIETIRSSETSIDFYRSARRYNSEGYFVDESPQCTQACT
jgi:hypothetical protein